MAGLMLGALDLMSDEFHATAAFDLGAPVSLVEALPRLLLDGEVVSGSHSSNRELTFTVRVTGTDAVELADREALLVAEVEKPSSELHWTPPGAASVTSVYETFRGQVVQRFDDMDELNSRRHYVVSLPALPHARSANPVTVSSTAALAPARTVLLDGSTTTGWMGLNASVVPATMLGRSCVKVTPNSGDGGVYVTVPTTSTLLTLDFYSPVSASAQAFAGSASEIPLARVATQTQPDGFTRYLWDTTGVSGPVRVFFTAPTGASPAPVLYVDDLATQSALPSVGKGSVRLLPTLGSVRAPATLSVSHPSTGLEDVVIFTSPRLADGFAPNLRTWRTAGNAVTADSTLISGAKEPLGGVTSFTATVPYRMFTPGTYLVMARVLVPSLSAIKAQANVGVTVFGECLSWVPRTTSTYYDIVPIGTLNLPPREPSPLAGGSFDIKIMGSSDTILDEAWVFPIGDGSALTVANELTWRRLWVEAPSLERARGGVWAGNNADQSDAYSVYSYLAAHDHHELAPGEAFAYVAASGPSTPVTFTATYHPRFHTNAAV